jgi:Mce-associated membrane protein
LEDQPADPGDLSTDATEPTTDDDIDTAAGEEATPRSRRWRFPRRHSKTPAAQDLPQANDSAAETIQEVEPARRAPVGKAGRAARPKGEPDAAIADAPSESESEPILVPHQPAGKRLKIAAVAAAVLFVAAAAFAGAALQPYLADRALVHTKLDVARTAANAITTLWTYTPDNMDSLPDRASKYLAGDFATDYRRYVDAIVAPNKQAQVTNTTQVLGAAVETLDPSEATAVVYTNSVATSPVTKNIPSLRYLSYRLTMERRDGQWLITRMSTITALDLTPQL